MKKSVPAPVRRTAPAQTTAIVPASGALVAMPAPDTTLDRAGRVNFFHRLSREAGIVAIRAAIAAGVELIEAKAELAGGFQNWVKAKCSFGLSTAYNYIAVAKNTLPETQIPALLEGSEADRESAIEAAATSTDSRTLTDLYSDLGIVKRTPSKMGGARPGAGRKSKAELAQIQITPEEARADILHGIGTALDSLAAAFGDGGGAVLLSVSDLSRLDGELKRLREKVKAILQSKSRPLSR